MTDTWSFLSWDERFANLCEGMKSGGFLSLQGVEACGGIVAFQSLMSCDCGNQGLYLGIAIDHDHIFDSVDANYCPACKRVSAIRRAEPILTMLEDFLPLMKKRIIDNPKLMSETKIRSVCPVCGLDTFEFYRKKMLSRSKEHWWRVCASPDCNWTGDYKLL